LAYVGRIDFKVQSFICEVEEFINSNSLRTKINDRFKELSQELSETTFAIFSKVVKSNLLKWREGEIKLISDLESSIANDADTHLKSEECLEAFEKKMEDWLKNLSREIQQDTHEICVRYGITDTAFQLEVTEKSVADSNMSRYFEAEDMVERKVWTMGSGIVGAILGGMVATFFTMSNIWSWGVIEITTGGVAGWIALLSIGLVGGLFGLSKIEPLSERAAEIIKYTELPKQSRLITDNQIDQMIAKGRPEFEADLMHQFEKQSETQLKELIEAIKKDLLDCADKARILIK
jgi:hypothetical protein